MSQTVIPSLDDARVLEDAGQQSLHRLCKRTFEVRLESTFEKNWRVQVPVRTTTQPQSSDVHIWELNIIVYKAEDEPYGRVLVSGKQVDRFRYVQGYCKVEVLNDDGECFAYKGPLSEPKYREFIAPPLNLTGVMYKDVQNLTVKVTLGSMDEEKKCGSLKDMYDHGVLTDVTIRTAQKDFNCHKIALAVASDYFRKMFESDMMETAENVVNWDGVFDAATVDDLLYHVYTGDAPPNIESTCVNLIDAACLCLLTDLRDICVASLSRAIAVDNAVEILQLAEKYDLSELKRKAVDFVVQNYPQIVESSTWKALDAEVAMKLMSGIIFTMRDQRK